MGAVENSVMNMVMTSKQKELMEVLDVLYLDVEREEFVEMDPVDMVKLALTFYTMSDLADELGYTVSYLSQLSRDKVKMGKLAKKRVGEKMIKFYDNHENLFRIISVEDTINKQKSNPFSLVFDRDALVKVDFDVDDLPF